eukprot:758819-Hanusia_phi.AAC.9
MQRSRGMVRRVFFDDFVLLAEEKQEHGGVQLQDYLFFSLVALLVCGTQFYIQEESDMLSCRHVFFKFRACYFLRLLHS